MKYCAFILLISALLLNSACSQEVSGDSSAKKNEVKPLQTTAITSLPERNSRFYLQDIYHHYSNLDRKEPLKTLKFGDYQIKRVTVRKKYDDESPWGETDEAILTKNGKFLKRFEGVSHPVANQISFGMISIFGTVEQQMIVFDESLHYEHVWIVRFDPKLEVIFDNEEYDLFSGVSVLDLDEDGVQELVTSQRASLSFSFARLYEPYIGVVFKFDPKKGKYVPAGNLHQNFMLEYIDEDIKAFEAATNKFTSDFLKIFLKLMYAGQEEQAWQFFERQSQSGIKFQTFDSGELEISTESGRQKLREVIAEALKQDKYYQFIKNARPFN